MDRRSKRVAGLDPNDRGLLRIRFAVPLIMLMLGIGPAPGAIASAITIMPLGDSITYGYSVPANVPGGYRSTLYKDLVAAGDTPTFVGSETANPDPTLPAAADGQEGHKGYYIAATGSKAAQSLAGNIDTWLAPGNGVNPNLILLEIGSNEFILNYHTASASYDLAALITRITQLRPNAEVLVSTITPLPDPTFNARVQAFNNSLGGSDGIVAQLQKLGENVVLVNAGGSLSVSDLGSDGIHPTSSGYVKLGNAWFNAVESVEGTGNAFLPHPAPEPSSFAVLGLGSLGLLVVARARRRSGPASAARPGIRPPITSRFLKGIGCHAVRYAEPVRLEHGQRHGFGVPNHVAPSVDSTNREINLGLILGGIKRGSIRIVPAVALLVLTLGNMGRSADASAITIMPLGDSITYGYSDISTIPGGYRSVLYKDLVAAGYTPTFVGSETANPDPTLPAAADGQEGHVGYYIAGTGSKAGLGLAGHIDTWLKPGNGVNPNLILLEIGTNEFAQNYHTASAPYDLAALITRITQLRPNAEVLVSTITPIGVPAYNTEVQAFNKDLGGADGIVTMLQKLGEKVVLVNAGGSVPLSDIDAHAVHPTAAGYTVLGNAWFQAIESFEEHGNVFLPRPAPEPSTLAVLGLGLLGLFAFARSKTRA